MWSGAAALFLAFLVLLAWQVRAGRDPALAAQTAAQGDPVPRRIVVRRIERRIVVERVRRIEEDDGGDDGELVAQAAPTAGAPAAAPAATAAPTAPVQAAPAPAPAPQPAAPLVTKTS